MSRPLKTGLDYFPMDVEMDDKVEIIEAKHGITGFGILIKLYQRIYKEGYFLKWTEEGLLLFSKRINVSINEVTETINDCLKYGIFDERLFKKYNILTSSGIQKRFLAAVDRRKEIELIAEYVIVDINTDNFNINWINVNNNTQRKVKESKVEESKGKKSQPPVCQNDLTDELKEQRPDVYRIGKLLLDSCEDVMKMKFPMSIKQLQWIIDKWGANEVERLLRDMENKGIGYLNKKNCRYTYLTVDAWLTSDKRKGYI